MDALIVRIWVKAFGVSSFRSNPIVMATYHAVSRIHALGG